MKVGKVIARLRKKTKFTQGQFAACVGITQATLSHIESGNKIPHRSTVEKICTYFNIPLQMFDLLLIEVDDIQEGCRLRYMVIEDDLHKLVLDAFFKF